MIKDVGAITATIVILVIGTGTALWEMVLFGHTITKAQPAASKLAARERAAVKVTGAVTAIDKNERSVTLVDPPNGTLTLAVPDPRRLDGVKVGDPVVATYYMVTSEPGDSAARPIESQVTLTVAAVDGKNGVLTIKGLEGDAETVKAQAPKILTGIKAGDLVQLTFTPALAVTLDTPAGN